MTPHAGRLILLLGLAVLAPPLARAGDLEFAVVDLPALRIEGRPARAHTQGLEIVGGQFYVTARRDDVQPRRALLLRTAPGRTDWDVWDITPYVWDITPSGQGGRPLDHPGGMQSDGKHLWIPLAESRRGGKSLIRGYAIAAIRTGRVLKPEFEFSVVGHIGALAVLGYSTGLLGASWDTEKVYGWDFYGRPLPRLAGARQADRGLGIASNGEAATKPKTGLAVQDWKLIDHNRLFASGLMKGPEASTTPSQSRLMVLDLSLADESEPVSIELPKQNGTELAREGMAISGGQIYFLPEDLGATNRLYRADLATLLGKADRE